MAIQITIHQDRANRRGVLLLVSLVLLSLFLMLGTTFIIMSRVDKTCRSLGGSVAYQRITESVGDGIIGGTQPPSQRTEPDLSGRTDFIADYPFENFSDPRGGYNFGLCSVLADKYGDRFISRSIFISDNETKLLGEYVTPLSTEFPFVEIQFSGGFGISASDPNMLSLDGRIIALVNDSQQNAVYRIVAEVADGRYLAYPVNPAAVIDLDSVIKSFTPTVLGREFTGDPLDGNDLHESYDVADRRNFFLSWVQPEAFLGRDQVPDGLGGSNDSPTTFASRYIVPSFHRPDRLLAVLKENAGDGQAAFREWLGFDNGAGGFEPTLNLMRPMGQMQWASDVDWTDYGLTGTPTLPASEELPHPEFTGSNDDFDPINGPWDVDNDGDGIADSVWIDIGTEAVTIDGTVCKPLVAIMLVDLDGRINLNAHGSTAFDTYGEAPIAVAPDASATGIRYAGSDPATTPAIEPHAAPGQGWGVADIDPVLVLEKGGKTSTNDLLSGTEATAGGQTVYGIEIPELKTEGRYGDSVAGTGTATPSPGVRAISDPSVDAPSGTASRDNAQPDQFGVDSSAGRGQRTPVDVWGTMTVAQDQLGQPFFARPDGTAAWQSDRIDDPYDISLGRTAPRPSQHYDEADPNNDQDNLFSQTQLARLLNLYDREFDTASGRLPALLGNAAEVARLTATTESWDTPAVAVPLHTLNKILALTDQAFSGNDSLVSWDVQMGIRMDINRPFGNGLDDDGDGIIDEAGENEGSFYGNLGPYATTNLCNGRDLNENARQLFARHLYCLTRVLCPALGAAEVAQFAVNVVDFRDSDSIMTRFQYDENFTDGSTSWNVTANSPVVWGCERPELLITEILSWRNIEETGAAGNYNYSDTGTGGLTIELYHPWTGQTNNGKLAHAVPAELAKDPAERFNPSAAAVDLAATHNGQATGSPVFQIIVVPTEPKSEYAVQQPKISPSQAITDAESKGGHVATITSAAELAEVQRQIGGSVSANLPSAWIGLVDPTGNADWEWVTGEPVTWTNWNGTEGGPGVEKWVHINNSGEWYDNPDWAGYPYILEKTSMPQGAVNVAEAIRMNPAWPTEAESDTISRVIYLAPVTAGVLSGLPADAYGKQWVSLDYSTANGNETIAPGQFGLVAGPADQTSENAGLFVQPIYGAVRDEISGLAMAATVDCNLRTTDPVTIGFDDGSEKTPLAVTDGFNEAAPAGVIPNPDQSGAERAIEFYRKTGRRLPQQATSGYSAVGAAICCQEAGGSGDGLALPASTLTDNELLEWISGNDAKFTVLLRRLANPTQPYDPSDNPYLAIDSMTVHDQAIIGPHATDSPNQLITLTSAERGTGQIVAGGDPNYENDIWKQSDAVLNSSTCQYQGRYNYCGKVSAAATIRSSLGYLPSTVKIPTVGVQNEAPWPWLTWLDRDFSSLGELLLVPGSSPAALLRDHTTSAPFGSLFFGGGTPAAPSDPAGRLGILEFLRVPSRFADAEQPISTQDAVTVSQYLVNILGGKPLYLPPHNYVSHFREPGRVNLNTLASPDVWKAIDGRYQTNVYEDEVSYQSNGSANPFDPSDDWVLSSASPSPLSGNWRQDDGEPGVALNDDTDNNNMQAVSGSDGSGNPVLKSIVSSRHGWAIPGNDITSSPATTANIAGAFDRVLNRRGVDQTGSTRSLWFDRPFQSGWRDDDNDPLTPAVYDPNYSLLMRRESSDFSALNPGDTKAIDFLFRPDADPTHDRPHADPNRNPYFWFRDIIRYANKVGCRSNVFAAWTTVGFFTLDENDRLSAEYEDASGSRIRPKRFQIIDRSLPVGYNPAEANGMNAAEIETFQLYHE